MSTNNKTYPSKGERLNWESLQNVKPVKLTHAVMAGKIVTAQPKSGNTNSSPLLLP